MVLFTGYLQDETDIYNDYTNEEMLCTIGVMWHINKLNRPNYIGN